MTVSKGCTNEKSRGAFRRRGSGSSREGVGFSSTGVSADPSRKRHDDDALPEGTRRAVAGNEAGHRIHQSEQSVFLPRAKVSINRSTEQRRQRRQGGAAHPHGLAPARLAAD